jgi:D-tagatose-1,6-bisphosphate aldolase subunit GatZ/KbaZ
VKDLGSIVRRMIELRAKRGIEMTLLSICPNSEAVLEAAIKSVAMNRSIILFAATLNQVDADGGYTGWTPGVFVQKIRFYGKKYRWERSIEACVQVDRILKKGETISTEVIVDRTIELIAHAEKVREGLGLPCIAYEVGTEEVHGGLADLSSFYRFISLLKTRMAAANLARIWPCLRCPGRYEPWHDALRLRGCHEVVRKASS